MTMLWVLTWKVIPGQEKRNAKARLVVRGFQDPDLQTLRAEAPTLARHSRHFICQVTSALKWDLENGDVKDSIPPRRKKRKAVEKLMSNPRRTLLPF